jgi:apolipoprotein N-acyltransferase
MSSTRAQRGRWAAWLGLGVVCGALVGLSIPPFGWWPLAWLGFAVLAVAIPGRPVRGRVALGAGLGVGQFVIGLWWVQQFSIPGYLTLVIVGAFYFAVAVALVPSDRRRWVAIALPATLVLAEWVRDRYPLGGFPLGAASLGQAAGPLAPAVRLGGSLLLMGVTVLAGVALAEVWWAARSWWALRAPGQDIKARHNAGLGSLAALGLVLVTVAIPLAAALSPSGAGGRQAPIRVALVQGGGVRGTRAIHSDPDAVFNRHLSASSGLTGPLDLVVWPEGMLQANQPYSTTAEASEVAALATRLNATVMVGVDQVLGHGKYRNELVAWGPNGQVVGIYVKDHLVPFGEYIPLRSVVQKLFNVSAVPYDGVPGKTPGFMSTPAGPLGIMISYEVFFDGRARGAVNAGGQVLVVPTNTASYRGTQVPTQQVAAARMRAQETGRWLVQVTPTGYTAVISPDGRVVKQSSLDAQTLIYATVPMRSGKTVYVRFGDTPVVALALAGVAVAWFAVVAPSRLRRPRRSRSRLSAFRRLP